MAAATLCRYRIGSETTFGSRRLGVNATEKRVTCQAIDTIGGDRRKSTVFGVAFRIMKIGIPNPENVVTRTESEGMRINLRRPMCSAAAAGVRTKKVFVWERIW